MFDLLRIKVDFVFEVQVIVTVKVNIVLPAVNCSQTLFNCLYEFRLPLSPPIGAVIYQLYLEAAGLV